MKVFEVVDGGSCSLSLALYNNVTNSKELLNSMQSGTLEPEVAFLNAQLADTRCLPSPMFDLVALFGASPDEMKAAEKLIDGKEIELGELEAGANNALIQKHYKISCLELGISSLADAISCRIAARDAL